MGFCTSPWFAEITLEALEINALKKLKSSHSLNQNSNFLSKGFSNSNDKVILFKRYVDDWLLIVHKDHINNILETFNNYNKYIQFTLEDEIENLIIFLDIRIQRNNDNSVSLNWYRKNTFQADISIFIHIIHYLSKRQLSTI